MAIWKPSTVLRVIKPLGSSTLPVVVETDAGVGYLKVINNPQGEHALAREWVGTQLAEMFGLSVYDHAILQIDEIDEIRLLDGRLAQAGSAFVSRAERGAPLGGPGTSAPYVLRHLDNPGDVARLVVFDTWTLNVDRYGPDDLGPRRRVNRDNVWFSREEASPGGFVLKAIDHSECFTQGRDFTSQLAGIDRWQAKGVYGLFPEFRQFLDDPRCLAERRRDVQLAADDLRRIEPDRITRIVQSIPGD